MQRAHPARWALLPSALACLAFLASCGGGDDSPDPAPGYASQYPALAAHAAMDDEDFERYLLTAGRGTPITPETIKSLSVGSGINSAQSTYNLRPIFDLGRLKEDSRLNVDTTRSQQKTVLRVLSSKDASTSADQFTFDVSASGSIGGEWGGAKGAAAYHHASAHRNSKSDGTVSVQMVSANTNNIVSILGSGFTGSENFTGYLIGTKLTDEQLRSYVATTESTPTGICGGKPYTTSVKVSRHKFADGDPYANIQILSRMEGVFADLKAQHEICADASIRPVLVRQMVELRGKIESAIAHFYAANGDAFVSQTTSMNQAIGSGKLSFRTADGNTESTNGGSISAQYQSLAGGVGGSTTLQFYKQNGWATALTDVQVQAEAQPAGVADTTAWVSSIQSMLKDQGSSLVPPMGSLPKDPGVKLPTPVGPLHDEETPPDVAFTSYDQWKEYLADKKKAADDKKELERAKKRVAEQPLIVEDNARLQSGQGGDAYLQLIAELDDIKERARQNQNPPQAGAGDGNLVRFDKMFVSGFETRPYDAVIPQLRPDLDIPGMDKAIGSFPNLMEIMLVSEKLGKLDTYLAFLTSLSVSNVTPEMSTRYHQFFQKASTRAYDLVGLALSQGTDLTPAVLAGYKKAMLGTAAAPAQSELYQSLQDIDYYNYVVGTLLDPAKGKAWTAAPGGYIPMRWNPDESRGMQLVTWTALSQERGGQRGKEGVVAIDFTNPNADPLTLYRNGMKTLQTPWYPVYVFNQSQAPTLVFVQHFGAYQAIYGARWVTRPFDGDTPVTPSLVPKWQDYQPLGSKDMRTVMTNADNDFLPHLNWDASVYFPNASNDPTRLQKYNAPVIRLPGDYVSRGESGQTLYSAAHSAAVRDFAKADYDNSARSDATYNAFRLPLGRRWWRMSDGQPVNSAVLPTYLMLLPLNATTTGESLKQSLNYAPDRAPMDVITPASLDLVNRLAVLLE
jgi:hypothetical protein